MKRGKKGKKKFLQKVGVDIDNFQSQFVTSRDRPVFTDALIVSL